MSFVDHRFVPPRGTVVYALLALQLVFVESGDAQTTPENAGFRGMSDCALCHNQPDTALPEVSRAFCRMNEASVFHDQDRHSRAYELYSKSPLTKQMRQAMKSFNEQQCLRCHGGWSNTLGDSPPPTLKSGVTCESCHGPSHGWVEPHRVTTAGESWRKKSGSEKESKHGMYDLRNPVRRAEVCASCHIGSHEEDKFITHEMYAAGHPVLPPFELASFEEAMSPHWRRTNEKGGFEFREEFIAANTPAEFPRTRDMLIGGVMNLRAGLLLLQGGAAPTTSDYAQFDCQSCHHELQSPAWRQLRPSAGRLGRLRFPEWTSILADLGHDVSPQPPENLNALLKPVVEAFDGSPLGDQAELRKQIPGIADKLKDLANDLAHAPLNETASGQIVTKILSIAGTQPVDFHSARQIALALRIVEAELQGGVPHGLSQVVADELPQDRQTREDADWNRFLIWRNGPWNEVQQSATVKFAAVDEIVSFDFSGKIDVPLEKSFESYGIRLGRSLERIGDYHPRDFRDAMREATGRQPAVKQTRISEARQPAS